MECADLIRARVPYVIRTRYVDGVPQTPEHMGFTVTKRDRFWRINGKIVPHGLAKAAVRSGIAQFQGANA